MKARNVRDYSSGWVQTVSSIVALFFTVAAGFGWITPEQSTEATPIVASTLGAVSAAIAGIVALVALFFKPGV